MRWNGASYCELVGKSMETERTTWSEFPNGGKAIVEQILASEERNKSKRAGLWESQSGIRVGKLTIWVRSFEIVSLKYHHQGFEGFGAPSQLYLFSISKSISTSGMVLVGFWQCRTTQNFHHHC